MYVYISYTFYTHQVAMWGIFVNCIWGAYLETLAAPKSIKKKEFLNLQQLLGISIASNPGGTQRVASDLCRCPSPTWREFHQGNAGDDLFSHLRSRFSKAEKKTAEAWWILGHLCFLLILLDHLPKKSQIPKQPLVAMGYNDNWVQKPHPPLFKHVHPWVHHWKTNDERW